MSILSKYYLLIKSLTPELGHLRVESKRKKWYWKQIGAILSSLSFGLVDLLAYPTTVGNTLYLPVGWEKQPLASHFEQLLFHREWWRLYKRLGFGDLWTGFYLLVLLSVLSPPLILAFKFKVAHEGWKQVVYYRVLLHGSERLISTRAEFMSKYKNSVYPKVLLDLDNWFDRIVKESEEIYETNSY